MLNQLTKNTKKLVNLIKFIIKFNHFSLERRIKSLVVDDYIKVNNKEIKYYVITDEAKGFIENGTPEFRIYTAIPKEGN